MKNITQKDIEKFKKYLQNEECAAATIEKYIRDIPRFPYGLTGRESTSQLYSLIKSI